jgi:hypothetical protein
MPETCKWNASELIGKHFCFPSGKFVSATIFATLGGKQYNIYGHGYIMLPAHSKNCFE